MFNPPGTDDMAQQRRTREQWQQLVGGWPASGLTQAQYCRRYGVSVASLHRWRERLRVDEAVDAASAARQPARLLPVELLTDQRPGLSGEAPLRLVLAEDLRVEVAPGFDAATLRRVVELLRGSVAA